MKTKRKIAGIATAILCTVNAVSAVLPSVNAVRYSGETSSEEKAYGDYLTYSLVDAESDGVYDYAQITGCDDSVTEVIIPSEIDGLPVTEIEDVVFSDMEFLKSVTIPDSVTRICGQAFEGCSSLESITIPSSVKTIGGSAFAECDSLTSVIIPEGVTTIEGRAFAECNSLTSIEIPGSVTAFGKNIFSECPVLTNVKFNDGLSKIPSRMFYQCKALRSVTLPDSVTAINEEAFALSGIEDITFGDNVTYIGENAFNATPLAINQIGVEYAGNWVIGCDSSVVDAEIKDGTYGIVENAFYRGKKVENITVPDSVEYIGDDAFSATPFFANQVGVKYAGKWVIGCSTDTTAAEIKDGTKGILKKSFYNCDLLESVTMPDSVTSLGENVFDFCYSLKKINISNNITSLPKRTFAYCTSLESIVIPDSVTSIEKYCFFSCDALKNVTLSNNLTEIKSNVFDGCDKLSEIIIPDSVTTIYNDAFIYCSSLKNVEISESVSSVSPYSFRYCTGIENIIVAENNQNYSSVDGILFNKEKTEIVYYPSNSHISEYTIPDTVTTIGKYAFGANTVIENIVIPKNVNLIDEDAFSCCSNLKSITIENPECVISDYRTTISNYEDYVSPEPDENGFILDVVILEHFFDGTIYGYLNSTAQAYAEKHEKNFVAINPSGDISGNGIIDLYDAIEIAKSLLGSLEFNDSQKAIADFDGNGTVDLYDAIAIAKTLINAEK